MTAPRPPLWGHVVIQLALLLLFYAFFLAGPFVTQLIKDF